MREAIVSEMQPEPLDRIEFGRVGRQEDQAQVFGHDEIAGRMPARLVHQHNVMRAATACPSSARKRFIAAVPSRVITKATPVSRAGHTAPMRVARPGLPVRQVERPAGRLHSPAMPRRLMPLRPVTRLVVVQRADIGKTNNEHQLTSEAYRERFR